MITQDNTSKWMDARCGRFTASTFGDLMAEPRSKADREAGKFGETAKTLITQKAVERLTGVVPQGPSTSSMRRGTLLEAGASVVLSVLWRPIRSSSLKTHGADLSATPDGSLADNDTFELKCPEDFVDVVRFNDEVQDEDFASLVKWNKRYAWQIMVQAYTSGSKGCWLVYFTDRLPVFPISKEVGDAAQNAIEELAKIKTQESVFPWEYSYATQGCYYAAKHFTLTPEIELQIINTLNRAVVERDNTMERLRPLLVPAKRIAA